MRSKHAIKESLGVLLTDKDVIAMTMPPSGKVVEVRENRTMSGDRKWSVWYPMEGYIPCDPNCQIKHVHDSISEHKMVQSFYEPSSLEDAMKYARELAGEREVRYIKSQPRGKKPRGKKKRLSKA